MALQNNPIFKLASAVDRGKCSEEEAFEKAASPEFLKTLRKKTFDEIIGAAYKQFNRREAEPLPRELTSLALRSALKRGLKGELWGMLNWAHAFSALQNGDPETGLKHAAHAKQVLRAGGFSRAMILCDTIFLEAQIYQGNAQLASTLHRNTQPFSKRPHRLDFATQQLRLGMALSFVGEHDRAIPLLTNAKSQFIKLARSTQHYRYAARKTLKSSQSDFEKYLLLHVPSLIGCESSLAHSLFCLGKYDASLRYLLSARKRCKRCGTVGLLLQLDLVYAATCRQLGDFPKAIRILEGSPMLDNSVYPIMNFRSKIYLATLYCDVEQYEKAIALLENVRERAEKEGLLDQVAECDKKLASVHIQLDETDEAGRLLLSARNIFHERGMDFDVAWCDADLAWLDIRMGEYSRPLQVFQDLKSSSGYWVSPDSFQQCSYGLAHVLWKMGRLEEARNEYAESIERIEQLRQGSSLPELRASYLEAKRRVYFEAIDCCLEQGDYAAALEYVERLKSRTLAEMLEGRDLSPRNASEKEVEYFKSLAFRVRAASQRLTKGDDSPESVGLLTEFLEAREAYQDFVHKLRKRDPNFDPEQTLRISYRDIRGLMPDPSTALIELFPMKDKTVAFLIVKDRELEETTIIIEDYTHGDLERELRALRDRNQYETILERLHARLFKPIIPYLSGIQKLIFIPFSGFHLVPLHAMFVEENGCRRYLIDEYHITYAPSARVLKQCLDRERVVQGKPFVASADPRGNLPYSSREAQAIAQLFQIDWNRWTTRKHLIEKAVNVPIFHFTGHANQQALVLHGHDSGHQEDHYDVGDIFAGLDLQKAWLVTLSACDTGKIKPGATDEYIGLPSAFLHAGASTVICSLWPVSDVSTTLLMAKMYRLINDGLGKAEALREAQLWFKNPQNREEHLHELESLVPWLGSTAGKGLPDSTRFTRTELSVENLLPGDLSHPYYWAGFICTGAP